MLLSIGDTWHETKKQTPSPKQLHVKTTKMCHNLNKDINLSANSLQMQLQQSVIKTLLDGTFPISAVFSLLSPSYINISVHHYIYLLANARDLPHILFLYHYIYIVITITEGNQSCQGVQYQQSNLMPYSSSMIYMSINRRRVDH